MKILDAFKQKNIVTGYLYFYVHFVTELICFFSLRRVIGDSIVLWISPLVYDFLAFVPQSLIGVIKDKHKNFNCGIIGTLLMVLGVILLIFFPHLKYIPIAVVAIGNAFTHIAGANATLRTSNGHMSHAAIFVAGGSFGVVTGKLLGNTFLPLWFLIPIALTMIPFCLLGDSYVEENKKLVEFNYANEKLNPLLLIVLATFVVAIRGYAGYGIPTSWNKTVFQTILLFTFMGTGKALGGILIDSIGIRKTALFSVLLSIPFLICGDKLMFISLIGVMMFSMTMAVTLGLLVSVLKNNPGLAFGYTTIGLFVGSVPIFFIKITSTLVNSIIITILSIICYMFLRIITRKDNE